MGPRAVIVLFTTLAGRVPPDSVCLTAELVEDYPVTDFIVVTLPWWACLRAQCLLHPGLRNAFNCDLHADSPHALHVL